jgi:predicted ribosome quality control (RQC) complex YloA/Tae2 family protein
LDDQTIRAVVEEVAPVLTGRVMGKVFQIARASLAIDFRTNDGSYLFLSVEPTPGPRTYIIKRSVRELEKQSLPPSHFALALRKHLSGATLLSLTKDEEDRIMRFSFAARDALDKVQKRVLVAQLTGRAANLFLLDEDNHIIDTLRPPRGPGQQVGERYQAPPAPSSIKRLRPVFERGSFDTLSEAADDYYRRLEATRAFDIRAAAARAPLRRAINQRSKLRQHLLNDMAAHGDAEEHRRIADLLLANTGTAERRGRNVAITDYYAEGAPRIELEIDENSTLQEAAAQLYARYAKARRAAKEITRRLTELDGELERLNAQLFEIERIIAERDEAALEALEDEKKEITRRPEARRKASESVPGTRRYLSSDGYEILVGRGARDNDHLTFRVARPHDLWLHAADYPGSHVVVRNPKRGLDIPHRTIIEAAQLAAHYSQARRDAKVDIHYTQRKFLSKPKGAAPGLVRISSFRTITVEPGLSVERILP